MDFLSTNDAHWIPNLWIFCPQMTLTQFPICGFFVHNFQIGVNKLNDRLVTESNFSPWQRYNEVQDSWAVFWRNSRSLYRKRHENHRYFSKIPKFFWQLIKSELPKLPWRVMITNGPILFPLSYSNIIFMKSHECAFPKYK